MKVIIAKKAGFCMGVRRAVDATLELLHDKNKKIATYGPLIHNPQVLQIFQDKGVRVLHNVEEVNAAATDTVIIRAHGVPPENVAQLKSTGVTVKDATCPRVLKVQAIIKKYKKKGYSTIIIGDRNHAEVEGLMGYARPDGSVVSSIGDVDLLQIDKPYIIVSQTTQDENVFTAISEKISQLFPNGKIFNTICDSTHKRQREVRELCRQVEAMVVVGGRSSANTKRLAEIAAEGCPVFLVETDEELDRNELSHYNCIGVTAGASTPAWMINGVARVLQSIPGKDENFFSPLIYRLIFLLLATNLYVSIGGGVLALACALLQGIEPQPFYFFLVFGYIFAMHNFNRLTDLRSKRFNDPAMAAFSKKYRPILLFLSGVALLTSHIIAFLFSAVTGGFLLFMSTAGLLYNEQTIPARISSLIKIRGLYEIPGSKTFLVALAWAFAVVLLPAIGAELLTLRTATVFLFVLILVFIRNGLFDIFDVHGDRVVGKETLPVCIGITKTMKVLYSLLTLDIVLIIMVYSFGILPGYSIWLIPGILFLFSLTVSYGKGKLPQGLMLEFSVDSIFTILGLGCLMAAN